MIGKQLKFLEIILSFLPTDMYQKRMKMNPLKKGFKPGLRSAASEVGISTSTYQLEENGQNIDIKKFPKISTWNGN